MNAPRSATAPPFTVEEVAQLMCVSSKTVMRAIAAGHLEASQITQGRGGWRIRPEALDAWLEARSNRALTPRPLGDISRVSAEQATPRRVSRSTRATGNGTLIA